MVLRGREVEEGKVEQVPVEQGKEKVIEMDLGREGDRENTLLDGEVAKENDGTEEKSLTAKVFPPSLLSLSL